MKSQTQKRGLLLALHKTFSPLFTTNMKDNFFININAQEQSKGGVNFEYSCQNINFNEFIKNELNKPLKSHTIANISKLIKQEDDIVKENIQNLYIFLGHNHYTSITPGFYTLTGFNRALEELHKANEGEINYIANILGLLVKPQDTTFNIYQQEELTKEVEEAQSEPEQEDLVKEEKKNRKNAK